MTDALPLRTLIGYRHGQIPPGANSFPGTALIDGVEVTHNLSLCVQPGVAIDIGRSPDGDLVWVSELSDQVGLLPSPQLFAPLEYSPELVKEPAQAVNFEEIMEGEHKLFPVVARYRKPALFAAGAVVVVLGITLFLPRSQSTTQASELPRESTSTETAAPAELDPASAAISFVLKGELAGLSIPPDAQESDFSASVVSQSGEIVLVDVMHNDATGLTTFATLLLQKSGTAWRIREVFDPR